MSRKWKVILMKNLKYENLKDCGTFIDDLLPKLWVSHRSVRARSCMFPWLFLCLEEKETNSLKWKISSRKLFEGNYRKYFDQYTLKTWFVPFTYTEVSGRPDLSASRQSYLLHYVHNDWSTVTARLDDAVHPLLTMSSDRTISPLNCWGRDWMATSTNAEVDPSEDSQIEQLGIWLYHQYVQYLQTKRKVHRCERVGRATRDHQWTENCYWNACSFV